MLRFRRSLIVCGTALLLCGSLIWSLGWAFPQAENSFRGDDPVEELVVELTIGEDGDDLDEPIALDLGLGFPLWLTPVGIDDETVPSFGAVPHTSTAEQVLKAGKTGTFTFRIEAEDAGQDIFHATPQLLAGVQISDIGRIGFSSSGDSGWVLDSYQIKINGETFAEAEELNRSPKQIGEASQERLGELAIETATIQPEVDALQALVEAEFASDEERERLSELSEKLSGLLAEQSWLEGQLTGDYPWFVDEKFENKFRNKASVKSVKVTLLTEPHAGADTHNYVYFQSGGHKYRLSEFNSPLSSEFGPQEFELDLRAGPLTTADLRSFAVGMIGDTTPFGVAPDRWHPQRILVEVDGRYMYDSDESPIDRLSLKSIRVIPPAHVDQENRLIINTPNARELFVWMAGQGDGLDLVAGGAAALPEPEDPLFPPIEPGLDPDAIPPDDGFVDGGGCFPEGFPPFPGEFGPGPGGFGPGGGGGGDPVAWWPPEWGPIPPWLDSILPWMVPFMPLPNGVDPPAIGEPFQIENVRISALRRVAFRGDALTVEWDVSGDEHKVNRYVVSLMLVHPEVGPDAPVEFQMSELASVILPVGSRTTVLDVPIIVNLDPTGFYQPMVTAIPQDPVDLPHSEPGPMQPFIRDGNTFLSLQRDFYWSRENPLSSGNLPVSLDDLGGDDPSVWLFYKQASHNGLLFVRASPAHNIAVRFPEGGGQTIIRFMSNTLPYKNYQFVAHAGFLGMPDVNSNVDIKLISYLLLDEPDPDGGPRWKMLEDVEKSMPHPDGNPPHPMTYLSKYFNTQDFAGDKPCRFKVAVKFSGTIDPAHPPALFGLRLIPR